MADKPFAQSCENNQQAILEQLQKLINKPCNVLEIGSGTGQHAVYFAKHLPFIHWQTSDKAENHPGIKLWLQESQLANIKAPLTLDVSQKSQWPSQTYPAIYTANTAHIMSWQDVEAMFIGVAECLETEGIFIQYGPFNKNGEFTSESNAHFQLWLKSQADHMGIRDLEELELLAEKVGLRLRDEILMPANNFILVWGKG